MMRLIGIILLISLPFNSISQYLMLSGEVSAFSEVFSSNDNEILLTKSELEPDGSLSYALLNPNRLSDYIIERIHLVDNPDGYPLFINTIRKYNGYWYIHLRGKKEYVIRFNILNKRSEILYSALVKNNAIHQDFYINDNDNLFLYRWVSIVRSGNKHVVEVNKYENGNLTTVFSLDAFWPEGLVAPSQNYKCIDMYKSDVFILNPSDGSIIRYSLSQHRFDTITEAVIKIPQDSSTLVEKEYKNYIRHNTMDNFNILTTLEDELIHYERIYVLNDSELVVNRFRFDKSLVTDSLIFINYMDKRVVNSYVSHMRAKDSFPSDQSNYFYLYYKTWAINNDHLCVLLDYTHELNDPELNRVSDLFGRIRPFRYLWSIALD